MNRQIYTLLLTISIPLLLIRLCWRAFRQPEYLHHWQERLALSKLQPAQIWIHAVSVGEVHLALHLIESWWQSQPMPKLLISCTTPTGRKRISDWVHTHPNKQVSYTYLPFDQPLFMAKALAQVQPQLLLLTETEIWPNLIHHATKKTIPVALINARLSRKSARRYSKLQQLTLSTFGKLNLVLAQTKADCRRFQTLGVSAEKCKITNNMKFDFSVSYNSKKLAKLNQSIGNRHCIWTIGSSRFGEETAILAAIEALLQKHPNSLVCWAPRHLELSLKIITKTLDNKKYNYSYRSQNNATKSTSIIIVDTFGELPLFYTLADVVFIGGTLVPTGSQNLIEPCLLGKATISGPSHFNFNRAHQLLKKSNSLLIVEDIPSLKQKLLLLANNKTLRTKIGKCGQKIVQQQQGATAKTISYLQQHIDN